MKKTLLFSTLATFLLIASCGAESPSDDSNETSTEQNSETTSDDETSSDDSEKQEMSRKKELLTSLIGDHNLTYVEGVTGANTMVEYTIHDALWSGSGSSNVGGTREAFPIELSNEDQKQINSMNISVADDLTVTFSCGGKDYFSVPFAEDEMSFILMRPVENFYSVIPEGLKESTTFINNDLYLYANDGFAVNELTGADILEIDADAAMLIYDETSKSFELSLFYGECCDTGIYTFQ